MSKPRLAARKDANHNEIADTFRRLGWSVLDIYQLPGTADILVARRGVTIMVEIKDGSKPPSKRRLTESEREFAETWEGMHVVVETEDDVIRLHEAISQIRQNVASRVAQSG